MAGRSGSSIPVIDISGGVAIDEACIQIDAACRGIGFFAITGHGVADELLDEALAASTEFFDQRFARPLVGTRLIRYPAVAEPLPDQLGCGAHSDYGCVTLLYTDGTWGLQLADIDGQWHDVIAPPGSFVVNLGDMLARWSNDRYRATVHRVQSPRTADRYSVPTFVNPPCDAVVDCLPTGLGAAQQPKYTPTTSGAYLQSRFDETFAYRR